MKYLFNNCIFYSIQEICSYITDNGHSDDGRFQLAMFDALSFEEQPTQEEWNNAFIDHFQVEVVTDMSIHVEIIKFKNQIAHVLVDGVFTEEYEVQRDNRGCYMVIEDNGGDFDKYYLLDFVC
ncbi:hypothetical protein E3U55_08190 [Filobacillus milosensis]|uniref:Uncharacterized protein n=1 Tax=Filobacillus milosensis TaxID=94137 RepID=A0A4Y8IKX4_9BACI|nr:hypothetical protein [Filobacillus milosensis]TFB21794.1 hypothetical protein E3U55_08190 [Filobacillus milosensis]